MALSIPCSAISAAASWAASFVRLSRAAASEAELRALTKDRDGESFANELMQNGVPSGAIAFATSCLTA